jgi:hypothetical protein
LTSDWTSLTKQVSQILPISEAFCNDKLLRVNSFCQIPATDTCMHHHDVPSHNELDT